MRLAIALIFAPFLMPAAANAQDQRPVLVELYTSQGCSSCPPADALLHDLAARDDVIALALHVDYWDYIGWKDIFGDPAYSRRQRGYAAANNRRMVYTPQIIVDGQEDVVGNRPRDVNALIERHRNAPETVALNLARDGDNVTVSARSLTGATTPLVVQMARYIPSREVAIKRGENAGRTISYANVVTNLVVLGKWDPAQPLSLTARVKGDAPVVVIVQEPGYGKVEATALLR